MVILNWLNEEYIRLLVNGLFLTIWLTGVTTLISLVLGVWIGTLKLTSYKVIRQLVTIYIEIHRNVPALVLIIFWAFAFPNIFPLEIRKVIFFNNSIINQISNWTGLSIPYYTLSVGLALTLNTSAYIAKLFLAGVGTIHQEHIDASRTLGAPKSILLRRIIIPQGLRVAFPTISTRLIHNMKNTALAAFVATPEFFHSVQSTISRSFRAVELLILAAVIYMGISFAFSSVLRWIERILNQQSLVTQNG
ncbi:MAG: amino acid ABC transporter permease [Chloroflexi bacterium]|nr:amino acid ABC transporter permease [Chloroflexota bacterium]